MCYVNVKVPHNECAHYVQQIYTNKKTIKVKVTVSLISLQNNPLCFRHIYRIILATLWNCSRIPFSWVFLVILPWLLMFWIIQNVDILWSFWVWGKTRSCIDPGQVNTVEGKTPLCSYETPFCWMALESIPSSFNHT